MNSDFRWMRATALLVSILAPLPLHAQAAKEDGKAQKQAKAEKQAKFAAANLAAAKTSVRGRVVGPLGEAIVDADVWYTLVGDDKKRGAARTDEKGRYILRDLPAQQTTRVHAVAAGHSAARSYILPGPSRTVTKDLRLWSAAEIRGSVVDEKGKKIAGAQVIASFDAARGFGFDAQASAESRADGSFVLSNVPLGLINVRAYLAGYVMAQSSIDLDNDTEIVLPMKRGKGRTVSLQVKGKGGKPLGACSVLVRAYAEGTHQALPDALARGITDADGMWSTDGFPAELELRVSASLRGHAMQPSAIRVYEATRGMAPAQNILAAAHAMARRKRGYRESAEGLSFVAHDVGKASLQLRGRIVDAKGEPVTRVEIECRRPQIRRGARAITGPDGHFSVPCFEAPGEQVGIYLRNSDYAIDFRDAGEGVPAIVARSRSFFACRVDPKATRTIRVVRGATIRGRVLTDGGKAAPFARVFLQDFQASRTPKWFSVKSTRADARGRFVMRAIHPGLGTVRIETRGKHGSKASAEIQLEPAQTVEGIELVVPSAGEVTGRIVDGLGQPCPGARVSLTTYDPATGRQRDGSLVQVLTDKDGRFLHPQVVSGHYRLNVLVGKEATNLRWDAGPFEVKTGARVKLGDVRNK